MNTKFRKYNPKHDFIRVRDFLKENYYAFGKPINWGIERWNWARYHPSMFDAEDVIKTLKKIQCWESAVGIWENDLGQIVGVRFMLYRLV